ncbi:MAG: hypothetical protein A2Y12_18745 [Planctomycetes bacterium GWF2_42_9]|nr:MAG: hypothetical protein A2Y12_18745 [Planctomycetes bacterium GWF2_42_9]
MENNDEILNKAVDDLKNRTVTVIPKDVLKQTAFWLKTSQNQKFQIFRPSLAAAAILIAASLIIYSFASNFYTGSVAWANVENHISRITFAHCYNTRQNDTEAWYIDGVIYMMEKHKIVRDDGKTKSIYELDGKLITENFSDIGDLMLSENTSPFMLVTQGVFEYDSNDVANKTPVYIGDDLLVYKFDAPKCMRDWASGLIITAGRQSKLPIYMKIIPKDSTRQTDVFIFDYEKQELPEIIKQISNNK